MQFDLLDRPDRLKFESSKSQNSGGRHLEKSKIEISLQRFVVGDVIVRLDQVGDLAATQLVDVLTDRGLSNHVTTPTHDLGGMLDVVVTRDDLPAPSVDVVDIGLSDHRLLLWSVPMSQPPPVYRSVDVRQWRLLDHYAFRAALASSSLCNSDVWSDFDANNMALVYDREITSILDWMIPVRTVTCRQRPSDPYFDDECRAAKRRVRRLERASSRAHRRVTAAVVPTPRHCYCCCNRRRCLAC